MEGMFLTFTNLGKAVETSGLYSDPCTFAADPRFIAPGTIIYVPVLSKYYIMEDVCGGCTVEYSSGQKRIFSFSYE